jgi:hypothetical protein
MASTFQTKIKNFLKKRGYIVLKIIKLSDNGYPDLYAFKKGYKDIWIESKEVNDNLKPLQEQRINELNQQGKIAFCLQKGKGIIFGSLTLNEYFKNW